MKLDQAAENQTLPNPDKIFLNVPYLERQRAKELGAKWDKEAKLWFAPVGTDLEPLSIWLSKKGVDLSPVTEFAQRLAQAGFQLNGDPIMNGQIQRVAVEGGKLGAKDGAYQAYLDGRPNGWFQNHKTGEKGQWRAIGQILTEEQKNELKQKTAERQTKRTQIRQEAYQAAAKEAVKYLEGLNPADAFPNYKYLQSKGLTTPEDSVHIPGYYSGVQINKQAELVVPGYDLEGRIQTIQFIGPNGEKQFFPGAQKKGALLPIEDSIPVDDQIIISKNKPNYCGEILLAEGYATGASLHMATEKPVAVAFDAGNLEVVAKAIREKFPKAQITICADNDNQKLLNIEGQAFFFDSKKEVLAKAKEAWEAGKSFDSGIMQVNNFWLKKYGIPLEAALDPEANVYLGSWILGQEIERHGENWQAVGAYHSPTPTKSQHYANVVKAALERGPITAATPKSKPKSLPGKLPGENQNKPSDDKISSPAASPMMVASRKVAMAREDNLKVNQVGASPGGMKVKF